LEPLMNANWALIFVEADEEEEEEQEDDYDS
jgi:hypothetical protein